MKGDLSRNTFERAQHYSAVRLQQGRIVADADWNEQADLTRYRAERAARDTIGACGGPMNAAGYALVAETNALAVHAVDANTAWIAAEDGVLLVTTDGGASWAPADLHTSANVRAMQQVGGIGWAVGDGAVVRKTMDHGASWVVQNAGTLTALRGVSVFDGDHAWAVGDGGTVVATIDGGANWSLVQTDAARLHAVHFIDQFNGVAVGQGGVIVTSGDGGQTWTAAASGTTAHLRALAVFGTTLAWAAGQGGVIVRSEDTGATWLPCNTPSSATLCAIAFRDSLEGWAAGEGGVLLHTTDGGANWALEDAGTTATLRSLSFSGSDPGWLVGDESTALRIGGGSPDVADVVLPAVNLSIQPGRCYVNGILCELEARASYAHQPDGGAGARLAPGAWLLYLDAWQRHVSMLEAPAIREVALGGPDTATRARTVAQVRALPLPASSPFDGNCDSTIPEWDELVNAPKPRLAARAVPQLAPANICEIAATAGYRRLENQLYRVEIHAGGSAPTFKWSRENGSVAYAVVSVNIDTAQQRTTVHLAARSRDANLDLAVHDRVELLDDDAELVDRAGVFFEYLNDGNDEFELVLAGVPTGAIGQNPARHPILRRWDHKPDVAGTNVLPIVEGSWIDLEDGVQVRFEPGGVYRPGDHWQIPARTITANVEWPVNDDGDPIAEPPAGILDAYCRLGIVEVADHGAVTVLSDCRDLFPPLTEMEQLLYVSGDGQDAAPNAQLPQPLAVRVARGSVPIAGRGVRFEVETGGGSLVGAGVGAPLEVATLADGRATARFVLDPDPAVSKRHQRVHASLLDAAGTALPGQTIVFGATATVLLSYVSGDGQEGAAGQILAHPLEVRVSNGQQPVPNQSVRFVVTAGGGAVIGTNPATTGADGVASVQWRLGGSGLQRVEAELLDAATTRVQHVAFNAGIAAGAAGGGCTVSIGETGDFKQLTNDVLKLLLERFGQRLCLCFQPGDHAIVDLQGDGGGNARVSIAGCGPSAVLKISGRMRLKGFGYFEFARLTVLATEGAGFDFASCDEVVIRSIEAHAADARARPLFRFSDVPALTVDGCTIGMKQPLGMAFVVDDASGPNRFTDNDINGIVSFYGPPGGDHQVDVSKLMKRLIEGSTKDFQAAPGRLFASGNVFDFITIGKEKVVELEQYIEGAPQLTKLFSTAALTGNAFTDRRTLFLSRMVTLGSTSFEVPEDSERLAIFVAGTAAIVGTVFPGPDTRVVTMATPRGRCKEAANIPKIDMQ